MKARLLTQHLGLGDMIITAPMAVAYGEPLRLPCLPHYVDEFKAIYINHPHITPEVVPWYEDIYNLEGFDEAIKVGMYGWQGAAPGVKFNEWFYQQADIIPFADRYKYCPIEKASESVEQKQLNGAILLHDDPARGFNITRQRPENYHWVGKDGNSVLSYVQAIREAKEIHCIDSSFFHLTEAVAEPGKNLYFHLYARGCPFDTRHEWRTIE